MASLNSTSFRWFCSIHFIFWVTHAETAMSSAPRPKSRLWSLHNNISYIYWWQRRQILFSAVNASEYLFLSVFIILEYCELANCPRCRGVLSSKKWGPKGRLGAKPLRAALAGGSSHKTYLDKEVKTSNVKNNLLLNSPCTRGILTSNKTKNKQKQTKPKNTQ